MKNKSNIIIRIVAILLIAVMVTSCAISSTFAKYVTSNSISSSARVAKWGVTVTATPNEALPGLRNVEFDAGNDTITITAREFKMGPGDSLDEAINFTVSGAPETRFLITVDFELDYNDADFTIPENTEELESYANQIYMPVAFYIKKANDNTKYYCPTEENRHVQPKDAEKNFCLEFATQTGMILTGNTDNSKVAKIFEPNETVKFGNLSSFSVGWEWPFELESGTEEEQRIKNKKDAWIASQESGLPQIEFKVIITVEQIQDYTIPDWVS